MTLAAADGRQLGHTLALLSTFATASIDFQARTLHELLEASCRGANGTAFEEWDVNGALAALHGIAPRDETETLLAAQMVAVHSAAMRCLRQLKGSDTIAQQDSNGGLAVRLLRTFTAQMEARHQRFVRRTLAPHVTSPPRPDSCTKLAWKKSIAPGEEPSGQGQRRAPPLSRCATRGRKLSLERLRPIDQSTEQASRKAGGLAGTSPERRAFIEGCADLHGVFAATVYRALRDQFRPRSLHRRDRGSPRRVTRREMERFCELIAAMKLRTTNLKGRHLSTGRAIELLVEPGIETPDGLVQVQRGLLTRSTVNRYLRAWGMDGTRLAQPSPAVRFQAEHSNDCWQFDLSPSDLKQVPAPL